MIVVMRSITLKRQSGVGARNRKLYDLAQHLQKEAVEGRLDDKEKDTTFRPEQEASSSTRPQCFSEYEESDDEIHTPYESEK